MEKVKAIIEMLMPILTTPELVAWYVSAVATGMIWLRSRANGKAALIFDVAVAAFNRTEKLAELAPASKKAKVKKMAEYMKQATDLYYARTGKEPGKAEISALISEAEKLVYKKKANQ